MNADHTFTIAVVLLLAICGALLYLDWLRSGEIEYLHSRLDALERGTTPAARRESVVERILHADDDRTLSDIARGNA